MMKWIVGFLLVLSFLGGGVGRLVQAFRPDMKSIDSSLGKTNLIILGLVNVIFSVVGMVFLLKETFSPLPILLGVSLLPSLLFILFQLKSRKSLWTKFSNK
jgi:hypothetical protein